MNTDTVTQTAGQGIASQLPDLGVLLKAFLERLLFTAS